jgi:hypothetical protein
MPNKTIRSAGCRGGIPCSPIVCVVDMAIPLHRADITGRLRDVGPRPLLVPQRIGWIDAQCPARRKITGGQAHHGE